MAIEYLEEFLELVRCMNYTVAARKLNLTQSALSKHIVALEKEFDATLIDRGKQHIELTRQGRVFCEEASKMLEAYRFAQRRMHEVDDEIRVAGALRDSAIRYLLSTAQAVLRESGAAMHVVSQEYPAGDRRISLLEGKVDLVIDVMSDPAEDEGREDEVEHRPVAPVPLLAVVECGNRLAGRTSVSIADLAGEPIMHPTGSREMQYGADAIEALFRAHGVNMRKRIFFATSWDDFADVALDGGVFVMPRSLFNRQLFGTAFDTYCGMPIDDPDACFPYQLIWRRGERRANVLRYIDALVEASRRIDLEA